MDKNTLRKKRAKRVRAKIFGMSECPRLCVSKSLRFISAQIIDDGKGETIVSASSKRVKGAKNDVQTARAVGAEIAKLAKGKKIYKVLFDRQGYKYHGKIKALADGAREEGLKF